MLDAIGVHREIGDRVLQQEYPHHSRLSIFFIVVVFVECSAGRGLVQSATQRKLAELEKVKQWRRSNAELLVVDVLVVSRKERHLQQERVVERWSIQHEIRKVGAIDMVAVSKKAYKKSIIVLRSPLRHRQDAPGLQALPGAQLFKQ
ncbi:hypothetical protein J5N97_012017 [Dioscorea zingiberensis]|uniref:Uncharacterized protein n=1 Tax=Dioscorea zingiberensis TaxID=325984 RepID=A0A9D5CN08_9LILI|nr:hypothetical protein J5N97_012017 [Dioscorea zingiberensis]